MFVVGQVRSAFEELLLVTQPEQMGRVDEKIQKKPSRISPLMEGRLPHCAWM